MRCHPCRHGRTVAAIQDPLSEACAGLDWMAVTSTAMTLTHMGCTSGKDQ